MIPITILVVDDEKSLRDFVCRNLEVRGYHAPTASNGIEAIKLFNQHSIDLVILDLMMPKMDGLEVIRRIRGHSQVPIIVLSALGEEADKIRALDVGADDYLTKPFGVGELLARVQAVLRRGSWGTIQSTKPKLTCGEIIADRERHEVTVQCQPIELTPTEYHLLIFLMENSGKVLTHEHILQNVWGPEYGPESEYLRVYIGRLRQKIEQDPTHPKYLITQRGFGYSFEVPNVE